MNRSLKVGRHLPPDPEQMNENRSNWAEIALQAFADITGTDREDALSDLLADLMHWCDRKSDISFDAHLARGLAHYQAETQIDPTVSALLLAVAQDDALDAAHDALSTLLESPEAGDDDIRDAAITLTHALNAHHERRRVAIAQVTGGADDHD